MKTMPLNPYDLFSSNPIEDAQLKAAKETGVGYKDDHMEIFRLAFVVWPPQFASRPYIDTTRMYPRVAELAYFMDRKMTKGCCSKECVCL